MAGLSGSRHAPELPQFLARDDVEGTRISRRSLGDLLGRGADDCDVAIDGRCSAVGNRANGNRSVFAEARRRLSGRCVDRVETVPTHEENPRAIGAIAWPVAHAALRRRRTAAASAATATSAGATTGTSPATGTSSASPITLTRSR